MLAKTRPFEETNMPHDLHDYAEGTHVRRLLQALLRRPLRATVRALLWLCPDTPIVANVHIVYRGAAIYVKPNSKDGQIINVRVYDAPNYGIYLDQNA